MPTSSRCPPLLKRSTTASAILHSCLLCTIIAAAATRTPDAELHNTALTRFDHSPGKDGAPQQDPFNNVSIDAPRLPLRVSSAAALSAQQSSYHTELNVEGRASWRQRQIQQDTDVEGPEAGMNVSAIEQAALQNDSEYEVACFCQLEWHFKYKRDEVPSFLRHKGIAGHYRPLSCFQCAAASAIGLHNETVNIVTHILAHFSVTGRTLREQFLRASSSSRAAESQLRQAAAAPPPPPLWPLLTFDVLASAAMFLSAVAHTFSCMKEPVPIIMWMMEHGGIAIGVLGVYVVAISYICHTCSAASRSRCAAQAAVALAVSGSVVIAIALIPSEGVRIGVQAVVNSLAIACVMFGPCRLMWSQNRLKPIYKRTVRYYAAAAGVVMVGAVFLGTSMPEVVIEGKFDLLGASHQLYHVSVVAASITFHFANMNLWHSLIRQAGEDGRAAGCNAAAGGSA